MHFTAVTVAASLRIPLLALWFASRLLNASLSIVEDKENKIFEKVVSSVWIGTQLFERGEIIDNIMIDDNITVSSSTTP